MENISAQKVTIILINWNQEEDTTECLESISKLNYTNYSVIVVDNGSTDGSYENLTRRFSDVKFVRNEENLGFAGGMNSGIDEALKHDPKYLLILNSDTVVSPQLLNSLVDTCEKDEKVAIAGPLIYNYYKPTKLDFAGSKVRLSLGSVKHLQKPKSSDSAFEIDFMTGCGFLIHANIIKKHGGFDPAFFVLFEDIDLSFRLRGKGFKIVCQPRAAMWHKISTKISTNINYYFWFRNSLFVINRYLSFPFTISGKAKIILVNFVKCLLAALIRGKMDTVKVLFWSVSDYFTGRMHKGRLDEILKMSSEK